MGGKNEELLPLKVFPYTFIMAPDKPTVEESIKPTGKVKWNCPLDFPENLYKRLRQASLHNKSNFSGVMKKQPNCN